MKFESKSKKYKDWLTTDWGVFFEPSIIDIPDTLKKCEELFDEKVLEIKKLIKDIGDLNVVISDKQLNLILYGDSNIIAPTYTQRFSKHLQIYGFISIPYKGVSLELIYSKNRQKFNMLYNIYKEYISLEIAYLNKPRPIKISDAKVTNISILSNVK